MEREHCDLPDGSNCCPDGERSAVDVALRKITGVPFYNTSKLDFVKLKGDPNHVAQNLRAYLKAFSQNARDILEQFKFDEQITRLDEARL